MCGPGFGGLSEGAGIDHGVVAAGAQDHVVYELDADDVGRTLQPRGQAHVFG